MKNMKKMWIQSLSIAVLLFAGLGSARAVPLTFRDLSDAAGQSAVQGVRVPAITVDYRNLTTRFDIESNGSNVNVNVSIEPQQLESIQNQGGEVEVRFYVGNRGQERRVREDHHYTLNYARQSFTLPYSDVCSESGNVSVKVWTTVKGAKRSYSNGEDQKSFYCNGSHGGGYNGGSNEGGKDLKTSVRLSEGFFGKISANVAVNDRQFNRISRRHGYVEVRLYAGDRKGQERRIEDATYKMYSSAERFDFAGSDVCNGFGNYDRYVKVWVSARDSDGSRLDGFNPAEGVRGKVTCSGHGFSFWTELETFAE